MKYTVLAWNWINVRGGGVVRALMYDGEAFYPCSDVPVIQLSSVADAESKTINGWVASSA